MRKQLLVIAACVLALLPGSLALAQSDMQALPESREVRATVTRIINDRMLEGKRQVKFEAQDKKDSTSYTVDTAGSYTEGLRYDIDEGTRVILQLLPGDDGSYTAYLSDVVRTPQLLLIFLFFCLVTLLVGVWRGAASLIGLVITAAILFGGILPMILAGHDPILVTVIGSVIILAVNMHLSHGFNRRTAFGFLSATIALASTVVFAKLFTLFAKLSGLAGEEATFLYWQGGVTDPVGLLVAGFILGATGVLDDIAVTQAETVAELREADPTLSTRELYRRAMRVGRHHIASTVNTLVLAYAGAAMPLFLLFMSSKVSIADFSNTELVAEEIVRTLSGTVALVLAVPLATYFAAWNEGHLPQLDTHKH